MGSVRNSIGKLINIQEISDKLSNQFDFFNSKIKYDNNGYEYLFDSTNDSDLKDIITTEQLFEDAIKSYHSAADIDGIHSII